MGQIHEYSSINFENEKFYDNTKRTDKILSMITNIINLLFILFKELSNDKNYENQFKLPFYQDTTNWNNPYNDNQFTKYNEFKTINEYYQNENLHQFFKKYNDVDKYLNINIYQYPKNGRQCFNCGNSYSHQCCIACKRVMKNCECVFICGLSTPCQYNRKGEITQYSKCKYTTSNIDNFRHDCKGIVFKNNQIVTFDTQNSNSYNTYDI